MHTFEMSGLGLAPFTIVSPDSFDEFGQQCWCSHCGTGLKNPYFVKSADGKVSMIGVDCARKSGDQGLWDGVLRAKREAASRKRSELYQVRRASQLAAEREFTGGKLVSECVDMIRAYAEDRRNGIASRLCEFAQENPVVRSLTKFGFEQSMELQAIVGQPYSKGQLTTIKEIYTKKCSGARKNSKAYRAAFDDCETEVLRLQLLLERHRCRMQAVTYKENKQIEILYLKAKAAGLEF